MAAQTQQETQQTSSRHKATVFIHPLGAGGPLELSLPGSVVKLLNTLDLLQRRQAGETIVPTATDAPALAAVDKLCPGEVEASIAGAVAQVNECLWGNREEVLRVSAQEKWALLQVRGIAEQYTERRPADERQRQLAEDLERLIYGGKTRAEAKAG